MHPHPKIKADHGINNKHPKLCSQQPVHMMEPWISCLMTIIVGAWLMRSTVGILSFYPWLAGNQSLKSGLGVSYPRVQVNIRALFVQVEEGGCRFHSHQCDSYHGAWFQMVWQITWQQGIPGSPACEMGLKEPGVANISPLPACVSAQLLGCKVSMLLGYQEMQKYPWTQRHPMRRRKVNTLGQWDSLSDLFALSA